MRAAARIVESAALGISLAIVLWLLGVRGAAKCFERDGMRACFVALAVAPAPAKAEPVEPKRSRRPY